jgi:hypothetical protein
MTGTSRVKGHCTNCGPDRNADVLASHEEPWDDEDSGIWGRVTYRMLKCPACDKVYFQRAEIFSENSDHRLNRASGEWETYLPADITQWPAPVQRKRPTWLEDHSIEDGVLLSLLKELYAALDQDLRVIAAIGIRTVFDRVSELLQIDPNLSFAMKLNGMKTGGHIGSGEEEILKALTDAGSAAAHRGWKPKVSELATMMDIIESFIYRSLVLGHAAKALGSSVPSRPSRRASRTD